MIVEWFRYSVAALRQLLSWQENVHNWVGWLGLWLALATVGIVLLLARDKWKELQRRQWASQNRRTPARRRGKGELSPLQRRLLLAAIPLLGFCVVLFVTCGTHLPRVPYEGGEMVAGVQLIECKGPLRAPYGLLVIIGGFGAESPMLAEPRPFREVGRGGGDGGNSQDALINLFRYRLIVHPQGGLGWRDSRTAQDIAGRLGGVIELRRRLLGIDAFPAVVIAHSRGAQIAELVPLFRGDDWTRIAVNPPAGVHWPVRLLGPLSPEIGEMHEFGRASVERRLKGGAAAGAFPWSVMYQSGGFDFVLQRFLHGQELPLNNLLPIGGHAGAFNRRGSVLWTDVVAELEKEKPYRISKRREDGAGPSRRPAAPPPPAGDESPLAQDPPPAPKDSPPDQAPAASSPAGG